jgi:CRP-like cAMP-binding protein
LSELGDTERILAESPLLSGLTGEKLRAIARDCEKRDFHPNEFLVREGGVATSFFLVLDGQVEVQRGGKSIGRIGPGQFFGETTLAEDESRSADVVAVQPGSCLVMTRGQLRELIESYPQIATKLVQEMIRRNRAYHSRMATMAEESAAEGKIRQAAVAESSSAHTPQLPDRQTHSFSFESDAARRVFESLADAFAFDYMVKKFASERSGWRTITELSRDSGVPVSMLYGKQASGVGAALEEPVRRGVVERRFFPGERGRGGEVVRLRIAYDAEPVRTFVAERIRAGKERK